MLTTGVISRLTIDMLFNGLSRLPEPGEELRSTSFGMSLGGGAVVSAVVLNRMGLPVKFGTYVDGSLDSEIALKLLKDQGLCDYRNLYSGFWKAVTISSVMPLGNDRSIVSYEEPCQTPSSETLEGFFTSCDVALFNCADSLMKTLKEKGKTIVLDVDDCSKSTITKASLAYVDIMTPNLREAQAISGYADPKDALLWLRDSGVSNPLVKLGCLGSLVLDGTDVVTIPSVPVSKVVDTTGAGDNFLAGLLYGYCKGWAFIDCVKMANVFGSLSTTGLGVFGCRYSEDQVLDTYRKNFGEVKA